MQNDVGEPPCAASSLAGMASRALIARLRMTCLIWLESARTRPRAGVDTVIERDVLADHASLTSASSR